MKFEIRSTAGQPKLEGRTIKGYAIVYNSLSHDLGGFRERFLPGSVTDAIRGNQLELWAHHDPTKPLASQASGTLRVKEDTKGVAYEADLPDGNTDAENLRSLLNPDKPVIGGTSFGFRVDGDGQRWLQENGENVREIIRADMNHISPVVTPAYPATSAALRSLTADDLDIAEQYGIDLDTIAKIFVSQKRGLTITDMERQSARQAIGLLRAAIQPPRLMRAEDQANNVLL